LEQLTFNVLQGVEEEYDPEFHTEAKMKDDIEKLYEMGQGKWGTNEKGLFKMVCAAPPTYLKQLNLKYSEKYGYTLTKVLEKELAGAVEKAAMFMIGMKLKPHEEVAKLIHKACAGFGTNELLLSATLIRYQSILKPVMTAYVELYGKTLRDTITSETGGDLEKLLLEIIETAETM
jgi:Annexin